MDQSESSIVNMDHWPYKKWDATSCTQLKIAPVVTALLLVQCCNTVIMAEQCCSTNNVVHYCFNNVVHYCFNNVAHYCFNNVVQHWWNNNGCSRLFKQEKTILIEQACSSLLLNLVNKLWHYWWLNNAVTTLLTWLNNLVDNIVHWVQHSIVHSWHHNIIVHSLHHNTVHVCWQLATGCAFLRVYTCTHWRIIVKPGLVPWWNICVSGWTFP